MWPPYPVSLLQNGGYPNLAIVIHPTFCLKNFHYPIPHLDFKPYPAFRQMYVELSAYTRDEQTNKLSLKISGQ